MVKEFSWKQIHLAEGSTEIAQRRYFSCVYDKASKKFFFFGGQKPSKVQCDDFHVFTPNERMYQVGSREGQMPGARAGHSAVVHNGKMYIFGGLLNKTSFNDFFSYDFATGIWAKIEPNASSDVWPSPREHHSAVIHNNHMYIFGGSNGNKKYKNDLFQYNFETNTFTELKFASEKELEGRAGHLCFMRGSELFIFGGYCGDGGFTYLADSFYVNLEAKEEEKKWTPVEFKGLAAGTARPISHVQYNPDGNKDNEVLYVFGGYAGDAPTSMLRIFDLQKLEWSFGELWMAIDQSNIPGQSGSKAMKPFARYGHATGIDEEGNIYIFFGTGSTYLTDIIEIASLD